MAAFATDLNRRLTESGELVEAARWPHPCAPDGSERPGRYAGGNRRTPRRDHRGARRLLDRGVRRFRSATEIASEFANCPSTRGVRATAVADVRPIDEYTADDA